MGALSDTAEYFGLLASVPRLRLLALIRTGESYCAELANVLNLAPSTVCRYLNSMGRAGFLSARRTTKVVFYRLGPRDTEGGKVARRICERLAKDRTIVKDAGVLRLERKRRVW